jgi:FdhE protein
LKPITREAWLDAHPYLSPAGDLAARIETALDALAVPLASLPRWEDYASEHREGVPVLESADAPFDLEPAGALAVALVERLAAAGAGPLGEDLESLSRELASGGGPARRVAAFLLEDEDVFPTAPGLLRCLGWLAAARYLRPVRAAYEAWRDEEKWLRRYCPICGSGPSMAQLSGADPGRMRRLVCGRCRCRWQFRRTQCPFCENDAQKLSTLAVEGERGLRIDHCESCLGYLKTYDGHGSEDVLLADWTSLHLDLLARDRGLEKRATSLFTLGIALPYEGTGSGTANRC